MIIWYLHVVGNFNRVQLKGHMTEPGTFKEFLSFSAISVSLCFLLFLFVQILASNDHAGVFLSLFLFFQFYFSLLTNSIRGQSR